MIQSVAEASIYFVKTERYNCAVSFGASNRRKKFLGALSENG
jgi:hypothetical protein